MGALVSPGGGDWEKSIEVPCIILSESTFYSDPILLSSHPTLAIFMMFKESAGWITSPFSTHSSSLTCFINFISPSSCSVPMKRIPLTISRTRPPPQSSNPYPTQTNPPTPTHFPPTSSPLDVISSTRKSETWMGITLSCCTCGLCSRIRGLAFMGCIGWRGEGGSLGQTASRLTPRHSNGRYSELDLDGAGRGCSW